MYQFVTSVVFTTAIVALFIISGISTSVDGQEVETTSRLPKVHRNRTHGQHRLHKQRVNGTDREVYLNDNDKYEEGEEEYYAYDDDANATMSEEEDDKFIETSSSGIVSDHVDFVMLRLKHISMRTSSNITEILAVQKEEMKVNTIYKSGWHAAEVIFNTSKRDELFKKSAPDSIVRKVPVEYHIAIIAYTLATPSLYSDFNKDTRDICSGTDIDKYQWKSFFKLLQLAIATLGTQEEKWRDNRRFLYRGASLEFALKENQVLAFQSFISSSAALPSAENFAGKTLFEYQGFYNGTAMAIWDHSFFAHEQEVLFSPLQVFRVDSIHVGSHYTRYVLVKHELSPPCDKTTDGNNLESSTILNSRLKSNSIRVSHENSLLLFALISCFSFALY